MIAWNKYNLITGVPADACRRCTHKNVCKYNDRLTELTKKADELLDLSLFDVLVRCKFYEGETIKVEYEKHD